MYNIDQRLMQSVSPDVRKLLEGRGETLMYKESAVKKICGEIIQYYEDLLAQQEAKHNAEDQS